MPIFGPFRRVAQQPERRSQCACFVIHDCLPCPSRHSPERRRKPMPLGRSGRTAPPRKSSFSRSEEEPRRGSGTAPATSTGRPARLLPRRSRRPCRPAGVAHADLRFPELRQRAARSVLCGDRAQSECLRAHGCHCDQAAQGTWHPQLGAALRRKWIDGRFVLEQETNA